MDPKMLKAMIDLILETNKIVKEIQSQLPNLATSQDVLNRAHELTSNIPAATVAGVQDLLESMVTPTDKASSPPPASPAAPAAAELSLEDKEEDPAELLARLAQGLS